MRLIENRKDTLQGVLFWESQQTSTSQYSGFQLFYATTKKLGKPYEYKRKSSIT